MSLGSSSLGQNVTGLTIYAVRSHDTVGGGANQGIFGICTNSAGVNRVYVFNQTSTGYNASGGRTLDADSFANALSSGSANATDMQIQTAVFDYTNTDLYQYIDGTADGSNTSYQSNTTTSNTAALTSAIGATCSGGAQYMDGDIAEIIIFHSAHNTATREAVEAYLRDKWRL